MPVTKTEFNPSTDFYIRRLSLLFMAGIFYLSVAAQIPDPIPEKISPATFTLILEDFIQLPPTSSAAPKARINILREVDDETGRLFVNDLNGLLYMISESDRKIYLNVRGTFTNFISSPGKGTGFGCFAFHPEFRDNGLFYTVHAESAGAGDPDLTPEEFQQIVLQWVLVEWHTDDPAADHFEGTNRELLRADFPDFLHGFQEIAFNPTADPGDEDYGLLYLCIGDGGSSKNFQESNLQIESGYLGTIFRIDPLGSNSLNGAYGIPDDNPFAADPDKTGEIYCYGFRNPHRISWDGQAPHRMYIGDIGEKNIEEVNLGVQGMNYGWGLREGPFLYDRPSGREFVFPLPPEDSIYQYSYPVTMYDHDEGFAIVGGYAYRGSRVPELDGMYLFGDIVNGRTFVVPADSLQQGRVTQPVELFFTDGSGTLINLQELAGNGRADLRFGQDLSGNIYILTKADGVVRRLISPSTTSAGQTISEQLELSLAPNPAQNLVQWSFEQPGKSRISIHDIEGKCVYQAQSVQASGHIDVSNLQPGIYTISAIAGKQRQTKKILIIR